MSTTFVKKGLAGIFLLSACSQHGLVDVLENPGRILSGQGAIYLYYTPGPIAGNLTSFTSSPTPRAGGDAMCTMARNTYVFPDNRCKNYRAFVSLSTTDTIANMPTNYGIPANQPIHGPNGTVIAQNWQQLASGTLETSLLAAGVTNHASNQFWSFSTQLGDFDSVSCNGGLDSTSYYQGRFGDPNEVLANWKSHNAVSCNNSKYVLCVCF